MLRVGLTGGIASGKSTVAEEFSRLGVPVVDADEIARQLTAAGSPVLKQLAATLGEQILDSRGELDRKKLRRLLFSDSKVKAQVEAILHPLVIQELDAALKAFNTPYAIAVIPLLVEHPEALALVDRVLVVDCPESLQISRLMSRDGETAQSAQAMLSAQSDREGRLAAGGDILGNKGGLADLRESVHKLHKQYLEIARNPVRHHPGMRLP